MEKHIGVLTTNKPTVLEVINKMCSYEFDLAIYFTNSIEPENIKNLTFQKHGNYLVVANIINNSFIRISVDGEYDHRFDLIGSEFLLDYFDNGYITTRGFGIKEDYFKIKNLKKEVENDFYYQYKKCCIKKIFKDVLQHSNVLNF